MLSRMQMAATPAAHGNAALSKQIRGAPRVQTHRTAEFTHLEAAQHVHDHHGGGQGDDAARVLQVEQDVV